MKEDDIVLLNRLIIKENQLQQLLSNLDVKEFEAPKDGIWNIREAAKKFRELQQQRKQTTTEKENSNTSDISDILADLNNFDPNEFSTPDSGVWKPYGKSTSGSKHELLDNVHTLGAGLVQNLESDIKVPKPTPGNGDYKL